MNSNLDYFKHTPRLTKKSTDGTSYHGVDIKATLSKLSKILGKPNGHSCSKVQYSWDCELPTGEVFTVYDWKECRTIDKDDVLNYHIGGFNKEDTIKVQKLLLKLLEK